MSISKMDNRAEAGAAGHQFRIPFWLGACAFLAIALFFLWEEHRAHILGALPYMLLLACPLLHVFMHHDHAGKGHHSDAEHRPERGGLP